MTHRLGKLGLASAAAVLMTVASTAAFAADEAPALFKGKCAACHAADGSGSTPIGKNLKIQDLRSAEVQKLTDAQLHAIITDGKGKMPKFGKSLTAAQIQSLVTYIRTFKK